MALNDYALRLVSARKHRVEFNEHARKFSSLRGLDKFTWEAWVKVGAGSTSSNQRCYYESQTGSAGIRFAAAPTRENNRSILRFELCRTDGGSPTAYTYVLPQEWDDRWHHIAFSANIGEREYNIFFDGVGVQRGTLANAGKREWENGSKKTYYIGGEIGTDVKDSPTDEEGEDTTDKYIPQHIYLGYNASSTAAYWDGKIDNVRIWKNAKSGSTFGNEMFDHVDDYATNDSLIEEWRFNDGPDSTMVQATKDSASRATLKAMISEGNAKELWIGRGVDKDYKNLPHDYDRPFIGNGLFDRTPPTEPSRLRIIGTPTTDSFRVTWHPSEDDIYVQRYEIDVATDSRFNQTLAEYSTRSVGRSTDLIISGLDEGMSYYWRVRAVDSANNTSRWASGTAFRTYTTNTESRINYSPNPSFEDELLYWEPFAETGRDPDVVRVAYGEDEDRPGVAFSGSAGDHFLRVSNTTTGALTGSGVSHIVPWNSGDDFTCSFYVRGDNTLSVRVIPRYRFSTVVDLDNDTTQRSLNVEGNAGTTKSLLLNDTWRRVSFTAKPTTKTPLDAVEIRFQTTAGAGLAYTFDLDCILIERGGRVRDYFDGSTQSSVGDFYWVTTPVSNEGRFILSPRDSTDFGYTDRSPSLFNPADVGVAQPTKTQNARDRLAPSTPRLDTGVIGDDFAITETGFIARWATPLLNFEDITGYDLDVSLNSNMETASAIFLPGYNKKRLGKTLSHAVTGLKPNTKYYYRVRAFDELLNYSAWSESRMIKTAVPIDREPPQEVQLLEPSDIDYGRFVANWKPSFDFFGVDHYVLSVAVDSVNNKILEKTLPATTLSYEVDVSEWFENSARQADFYYSVRAVDAAGNSSVGLRYDDALGAFDPATYQKVELTILGMQEGQPVDITIPLLSAAVVDSAYPNTASSPQAAFALSGTRRLLVNLPIDALGSIDNAQLYLNRVATRTENQQEVAVAMDWAGTSHAWANLSLNGNRGRAFYVRPQTTRSYPPVEIEVTALALPEDRTALVFNPTTVTHNAAPSIDADATRTVSGIWDQETFSISLSPLLTSGIRTYGFVVKTKDSGVVAVRTALTSDVTKHPFVTVTTNPADAMTLLTTQVRPQPVTAVNIYPNPTFDTVESAIPLFNASLDQGTVNGWSVANQNGAVSVLSYDEYGADNIGGSAKLLIQTHPAAANVAGADAPIRIGHDKRFRVDPDQTYSARIKAATDNRELTVLIGFRWFETFESQTLLGTSFCASWRPARTNTWFDVSLQDVQPPATAKYGKLVIVPQPLQANQTGTIWFDDVHIDVSSGELPVNVHAEDGASFTRVSGEVDAFMRGPDAANSVLRATFDAAGEQIRLTAQVDDREPWLRDALAQAVVNLMENPSFESSYGINDATKYFATGAVTLSRSRVMNKTGSYGLLATFTDRSDESVVSLRSARIDTKMDTAYVASFDAKGTGSYTARLYAKYTDNAVLDPENSATTTFAVVSTEWTDQRVQAGIEIDPTRTLEYVELQIEPAATPVLAQSALYLDNVQIEATVSPTSVPRPYCDGSLRNDNCFWYGAQDRSISFRNAFLSVVRLRTPHIDPALKCWTELRYADAATNAITIKSAAKTMAPLVPWENNRAVNPNYWASNAASLTGWTAISYAGTAATWTADTATVWNRFGNNDTQAAKVTIASNTNSSTVVAELENTGMEFSVTAGQRVYARVMARSTNANLLPYLKFYFYSRNPTTNALVAVGTVSGIQASVTANKWESVTGSATVPVNAQVCRVALAVYSAQTGSTGSVFFSSVWAGETPIAAGEYWVPALTLPHAPVGEYASEQPENAVHLIEVDFVIEATKSTVVALDLDAAAIKFNNNDLTTFNGSTLTADWVEQPFGSQSELYASAITNLTYYGGDKDNSATVQTLVKPYGWPTYDLPDAVATRYNRDRRSVEAVVPALTRWNELSYGAFYYDKGWQTTQNSTLARIVPSGSTGIASAAEWKIGSVDFAPRLISVESIPAQAGQLWSASIGLRAKTVTRPMGGPLGGRLTLKFYDAQGTRLEATSTAAFDVPLTAGGNWETGHASAYAPEGTAWVTLEVSAFSDDGVLSMLPGDVYEVRQALLYRGQAERPYYDGATSGCYWEGMPYASPTLLVLRPRERYSVLTLPSDEDGVASAIQDIQTAITLPPAPARYVRYRFANALIEPDASSIQITVPYDGDDGQLTQIQVAVRRDDRYERDSAEVQYLRAQREVVISKGGLAANTEYVFEVSVNGPPGRLRGDRDYLYRVKTGNRRLLDAEKTNSTVSYGGFMLNGVNSTYYWVTRHDSFSLPARRMQIETLPRMDGAVELNSYWEKKTITMEGGVWGETLEQLDANIKDLRAALAKTKQKLFIDTLTNGNSYYMATCSTFTVTQAGGEALTGLAWNATFECSDPFLYRGDLSTYTFNITSKDISATADDVLSSDQEFIVTNNGTVYALPTITVKANNGGGSYAVVVYNDTNADRLMPKELLAKGEYFIFDSMGRSCTKQGGIAIDYTGSFLQLVPGDNKLRVSIKSLTPQRHNLLANPSADDAFVLAGDTTANIYGTYTVNAAGKPVAHTGVTVTQERTQTYNGSPYAAYAVCDGQADNQGIVLRTGKSLTEQQSWRDDRGQTFVATAAIRTDDISRNWYLAECFLRVWYVDGTYDNFNADTDAVARSGRVGTQWDIVTTKPFTSAKKKIDYVELILRDPTLETNSKRNLDVSFYVDECRLVRIVNDQQSGEIDFGIQVEYRERFI